MVFHTVQWRSRQIQHVFSGAGRWNRDGGVAKDPGPESGAETGAGAGAGAGAGKGARAEREVGKADE